MPISYTNIIVKNSSKKSSMFGTRYSVFGIRYSVLGIRYSVLGTRYSVLGIRYSVLLLSYQVTYQVTTKLLHHSGEILGNGNTIEAFVVAWENGLDPREMMELGEIIRS